jgi:hypothetical protein
MEVTLILNIPYELFHLICEFLPLVDVRLCTLVCHTLYDWIIGSQIYQSSEYKKLIGNDFNYEVARLGYLNILTSICDIKASMLINRKLYFAAIYGNHPEIVKWLLTQNIIPKKKAINRAIIMDCVEILQQILPVEISVDRLSHLMSIVALYGSLNSLKILELRYPDFSKKLLKKQPKSLLGSFAIALRYNNLSVAAYCLDYVNLNEILTRGDCRIILGDCNIETYNWIVNLFACRELKFMDENEIYDSLFRGGNYTLMMQLHESRLVKFIDKIDTWKSKWQIYCKVDVLQWFYDHGVKFDNTCYGVINIYSFVNSKKYLEILKWLYDKVGPDSSTSTINKLHTLNNVEVAEWIHRHGFNCDFAQSQYDRRWGLKVIYYLCDPSEHGPQNCGADCRGPILLSDRIKNFLLTEFNDKSRISTKPNFKKLYNLIFK